MKRAQRAQLLPLHVQMRQALREVALHRLVLAVPHVQPTLRQQALTAVVPAEMPRLALTVPPSWPLEPTWVPMLRLQGLAATSRARRLTQPLAPQQPTPTPTPGQ